MYLEDWRGILAWLLEDGRDRLVRVVGECWRSTLQDSGLFVNEVGLVYEVEHRDGTREVLQYGHSRWLSIFPLGAL
jgi:hypothetical protein